MPRPADRLEGKNILLDGRHSICRHNQHNIPFKVEALEFSDREAAEAFIVKNQLGRRNLSPESVPKMLSKNIRMLASTLRGTMKTSASSRFPKVPDHSTK